MSPYSYSLNKPLWDPSNFTFNTFSPVGGWNGGFGNFQMPWFGTSSSSDSTAPDSYEAWKKEELKRQEEEAKKSAFLDERSEEVKKTKELIEAQENIIKNIKKGKKADGSYVVENAKLEGPKLKEDGSIDKEASKPKKKGFWAKAGEWVCSAGSALKNMGKSLIGFDENGKWSWKKCLKNVAITAAAIGATFIPVVGPAIGYGLLAYGVVSGGVGVAKGISKLNKAKTEEAKEQARQDICSGAFVGISSAIGLRGLGKSVSAAAKASGTNTTTMGISAVAKARTGLGKPIEVISQATRDMTVNAFKATTNAMQADKALIAANGGGIKGFGKAYANKVNTAVNNCNNWSKRYQDKYAEMETSLNNRISELNSQIAAETNAAKRTLLQEQKAMLESNLNELRSISGFKSKTEFDRLNTENSGIRNQEKLSSYTQNSSGSYEINGQSISGQSFEVFQKEIQAMQKSYIKDLKKLNQFKEAQMRSFSKHPDSHRRELNEYTDATVRAKYNTKDKLKAGIQNLSSKIEDLTTKIAEVEEKLARATSPRKIANLRNTLQNLKAQKLAAENELAICNSIKFKSLFKSSTWLKNEYSNYIGGSNASFGALRSYAGKALTHPAAAVPLTMGQWGREYSIPMFGSLTQLTKEQGEEYITQLEQQIAEYEKTLEALNEIESAEEWETIKAQYAAQLKAQEEAQAAAQAAQEAQGQQ